MNKRVLFVDDDQHLLSGLRRTLHHSDYEITTINNGIEALSITKKKAAFAVVVCDMHMPGMDGIEVLERIQKLSPHTSRIMLTGNADLQTAIDAVNKSRIFRFLTKPCPDENLLIALEAGVRQYQLVTAEQELLQKTLAGSVKVLTDVMALVVPKAFESAGVVRKWVRELAPKLDVDNLWAIEIAALISRIGFVTIPDDIQDRSRLNKRLDSSEKEILARAPQVASNLIRNLPRMEGVASILQYQWKGFDGSGVPQDGKLGGAIPRGARILRILTDLAAVTKGTVPDHQGFAYLRAHEELYDPGLLPLIITHFTEASQAEKDASADHDVQCLSLNITALRVGDLLISDICRKDASLLLASGTCLSEIQIEKLRNIRSVAALIEPVEVERRAPNERPHGAAENGKNAR